MHNVLVGVHHGEDESSPVRCGFQGYPHGEVPEQGPFEVQGGCPANDSMLRDGEGGVAIHPHGVRDPLMGDADHSKQVDLLGVGSIWGKEKIIQ